MVLAVAPNPVAEGSAVTVTVRLSRALARGVTIPLTLTDGSAEPEDHGTLESITVAAGARSGTGTISTAQDSDRDDETFTVALGRLPAQVAAGSPSAVEVTIADGTPPTGGGDDDDDDGGDATPSADASLSELQISEGVLAFDPATTSYAVAVAHEVESVTLTPTVNHAGATVAVHGAAVWRAARRAAR